jgi:hypothetical protein
MSSRRTAPPDTDADADADVGRALLWGRFAAALLVVGIFFGSRGDELVAVGVER